MSLSLKKPKLEDKGLNHSQHSARPTFFLHQTETQLCCCCCGATKCESLMEPSFRIQFCSASYKIQTKIQIDLQIRFSLLFYEGVLLPANHIVTLFQKSDYCPKISILLIYGIKLKICRQIVFKKSNSLVKLKWTKN